MDEKLKACILSRCVSKRVEYNGAYNKSSEDNGAVEPSCVRFKKPRLDTNYGKIIGDFRNV